MEEAVVLYYDMPYGGHTSVLKREETLKGSKEEIFKSFYDRNRRLRYCNGCYYKFKDPDIDKEYNEWFKMLDDNTKFRMYYGNSTVD